MQRLLLTGLLAGSLALLAGAETWATAPLVAASLATAAACARSRAAFPRDQRAIDGAIVAVLILIVLQLVPLPASFHDLLSPHAAGLVRALRLDGHLAPSRLASLTVDAQATRHALGSVLIAALTFWAARGALAGGGTRRLTRAVVVIGGILAVAGLVSRALDPARRFGVFESAPGTQPFGPFVNRNHFAAWLLMAIPLAAGYLVAHIRIHARDEHGALQDRDPLRDLAGTWAIGAAASLLVMIAAVVATRSRSAIVGLGVAALVGWRLGRSRLAGAPRPQVQAIAALAGVAALALLLVADIDGIAARFASTLVDRPVDRSVIWRETLPLIGAFWLTGVGAGAYGTAMLVYQETQVRMPHLRDWVHFNQAHSHYLQVGAEGGVLLAAVAIAGLAALVWVGRQALRSDHAEIAWIRVGAAAGLAGVATQSLWETALTIPANAIVCAVSAALLVYPRRPPPHYVSDAKRSDAGRDRARQLPDIPVTIRRT